MLRLRERFLAQLGLRNKTFVSLHVRRGDTQSQCKTSVAEVLRYVACSRRTSARAAVSPIVVFTDEREPRYLAALLSGLASAAKSNASTVAADGGARHRATVHHGDALLERLVAADDLPRGDNFLIYAASSAIKEAAEGWLVQRHDPVHGDCNECDDPFAKRQRAEARAGSSRPLGAP